MDEKAATSAVDTDELASMGPKTAKLKRPDENKAGNKGNTTRIALPDEEKIRKARRANATQDLGAEDALPSAEQIEMAQKNATMPIMIDTESVEDNSNRNINDTDGSAEMDRTMEIDAEALQTANLEKELQDADDVQSDNDQTMKIDPDALATGNIQEALEAAESSGEDPKDQTMKIDEDALATGNLEDALNDADSAKGNNDQTLEIDSNELEEMASQQTQELEEVGADDAGGDQTMQIDPEALATGNVDPVNDEAIMSMETMQMDPIEDEDAEHVGPEAGSDLTIEEMKESFNAQTMEMDASMLADELAKKNSGSIESVEDDGQDRSKTMDLSESRPKTHYD